MASVSLTASGITFADYQTPTSAGSMASELLDHYEEGTWTPKEQDASTLSQSTSNFYVKIGKIVYLHCDVTFNSTSNGIHNLPFQLVGSKNASFYIGYNTGTARYAHSGSLSTTVTSWYNVSNVGVSFASGNRVMMSGFYEAA